MRRREFTKRLAAGIAALLSPFPRLRLARAGGDAGGIGATLVFGYPNGFAGSASAIVVSGDGALLGSTIRLVNNPGHDGATAWYKTMQPPTAFTTQFSFLASGLGSGPVQSGMTFCIQNTVSPPGAPGFVGTTYQGDANMCGYGGATNQTPPVDSIAIKLDASSVSQQAYPAGGVPSSTGLYFNGGPSVYPGGTLGLIPYDDLNPNGIDFYSGHTFEVTLVYDGSLLTMLLVDTTTQAQARRAWPLNLANTTNAKGNYVGFTAGTSRVGVFELLSWSYWLGYSTRLATPSFSPPPGQVSGSETVTILYPAGSTCYYTTNGLLPTSASTKYTGPFTVSANAVIQAVAIQAGFTDSLVATGVYQVKTANVIDFPTGFSAGQLVPVGFAYLRGSAVRVTDTTGNTAGAAWFPAPVTVTGFSTEFTLQWGSNGQGAAGQGMCFVLQNNAPLYTSTTGNTISWSGGPTVVGAASNALGYGGLNAYNETNGTSYGLLNSVAIAFNQYAIGGDPTNGVGLYTNGADPFGSQIATKLTFSNGHPFKVSLTYAETSLSFTMTDIVTGATFTHAFTIDIPKTVGGNTAYVGFTGGTGGAASIQAITAWTYTVSPEAETAVPNAPTSLRVE